MDEARARRVLAEAKRRTERAEKVDFSALLFPQQLAFVTDQSRHVAACCSRRAGKSEAIGHKLVKVALSRGDVLLPYITLTKQQGKRILWPVLRRLNARYGLNIKFNSNELTATFPNGSQIFIVGGSEEAELERLRGPKYPVAVFDEAQAFGPFLASVIEEIVEPAVMDYDGQIFLTGTPNAACVGTFYEATNGFLPEYSVHHWTARDNPHLPHFAEWIEKRKQVKRWTDDDPVYRREWLGEWVKDEDSLVYKVRPFNLVQSLPEADDWVYVLGIDLGYVDSTAFVVMAYSVDTAQAVTVESYKESGLIPSAVAARVSDFEERYSFGRIVADSGGLGKGYVEEMRQRFGMSIEAAEKRNKAAYIDLLNGDLKSGQLFVVEHTNQDLLSEVKLLQWDEDRRQPDPRYEDHLADAWLYAWRYCHQFLHESERNAPEPGSIDWWKAEMDRMEAQAEEELRRQGLPYDPDWD